MATSPLHKIMLTQETQSGPVKKKPKELVLDLAATTMSKYSVK